MLFHKVAPKDASAMQTNNANGEIFYDNITVTSITPTVIDLYSKYIDSKKFI
ncbi:MAG: hypothetical protein HQ463_09125 [Bacteroidetes bacterium]|nr:hypothetical protein [Bacteroidota bacterium]